MDHVKIRGRSKFFTCFSPVFADDDTGPDSESSVRRKKRFRRAFAAAMKAVFSKTSSDKKSRNKKSGQDSFRSNSGYSSSSANAKSVNTIKNSEELLFRTSSNASSIFSPSVTDSSRSSSRSSSISSNSRSGSERIKRSASSLDLKQTLNPQAAKRDGEKCGCTVGMCIFLICLAGLVFWGKVFAIVTCTSACLFFAPCPRQRRCRLESAGSSVDLSLNYVLDSEDKKRVIMEGLLERKRPRILQ